MDKRLILSVAGAGKSTMIVRNINLNKRYLILTYTENNYKNILKKINKVYGIKPDNVCVMTYFSFLYNFCYKPLLSNTYNINGICYDINHNRNFTKKSIRFYITNDNRIYFNRLSLFLENNNCIEEIKMRLARYFDVLMIDEVQDLGGRDFDFILSLSSATIDFLFVGDFFQHTYSTSYDGNKNSNLYDDYDKYIKKYREAGFLVETETLKKSWRCSPDICLYISDKLGINIESNRDEHTYIKYVTDNDEIKNIWNNSNIVKLHYQRANDYGINHKNWGDTKGLDDFNDICILLNKSTYTKFIEDKLIELPQLTKNKFYVALTRARGNVFLIKEESVIGLK